MDLVHQAIALRPADHPAVILDNEVISYAALNARANGAARWLVSAGVRAGDVVAVSVSDAVLQVCMSLGLMQIGARHASLDPRLLPQDLSDLVGRLGVTHLVSDVPRAAFPGVAAHAAPPLASIVPRPDPLEPSRAMSEHDEVLVSHGSGTTGVPKIMALRHRHLLARFANISEAFTPEAGERTFILQRHTSPTYLTRALQCLFHGGCLIEVRQMRQGASNYWELFSRAVDEHDVDHVHCTAFHAKAAVEFVGSRSHGVRFRA